MSDTNPSPDTGTTRRRPAMVVAACLALGGFVGVGGGTVLYPPEGKDVAPISAYVDEAYRTFFDRRVDGSSLTHWQQAFANGLTRELFIETLVTSQEWREVVTRHLDSNLLGRPPEATITAPVSGTQTELEIATLSSDDFYQAAGGTDDAFLSRLRHVLLGASQADSYDAIVTEAFNKGGRTTAVVAALATHDVADQRVRHGFRMIERRPTDSELTRWIPVVAAGDIESLMIYLGSTDRFAKLAQEYRS